MLAVAGRLPDADGWRFELKWDGVRALAYVEGERTRLISRSGRDLSETYAPLVAGATLNGETALVDGEVVAFDREGRPSFQLLQSQLRDRRAGRSDAPLAYLAFDILQIGETSLLDVAYEERRRRLEDLEFGQPAWSVPQSFGPPGADVLAASAARGLEGVVAKRLGSRYTPGKRSDSWVKVKNFLTQEVIVGGWTEGEGRRQSSFGSLLLGVPGEEGLDYVGNVGTGFDDAALDELLVRLRALERETSPFSGPLRALRARRARFCEPRIVGEVRFAEWTADGRLRQASWRGLRQDKSPDEVRRES